MTEVQLAIYDLSKGMARALSGQFLGPDHAIDIVPHTAILVHGKEYFFGSGGGISAVEPMEFRRSRQMVPMETKSLGSTMKSKEQFDSWCREMTVSGKYASHAYDLLNNNCNNFSHDAATRGLGLPNGVPEWILQVPQKFLSSPMGQMIRPMLEQMQLTSNAPVQGDPTFSSIPTSSSPNTTSVPNPWANISTEPEKKATSDSKKKNNSKKHSTPTLDSLSKPLLSKDSNTVKVCVSKVSRSKCLDTIITAETEKQSFTAQLENLASMLTKENEAADWSKHSNVYDILFAILESKQCGKADATFALMILRLVVLHVDLPTIFTSIGEKIAHGKLQVLKAPSSRSMTWCVLSNFIGSNHKIDTTSKFFQTLTDTALQDLYMENQDRVEVRQSAAAFLYNAVLYMYNDSSSDSKNDKEDVELEDIVVSLICGTLESITNEVDATIKIRRLLVLGKIISKQSGTNDAAKRLVVDLGYGDVILSLKSDSNVSVQRLASEINSLIS